jgi:type IV pilus assembly protein PilP
MMRNILTAALIVLAGSPVLAQSIAPATAAKALESPKTAVPPKPASKSEKAEKPGAAAQPTEAASAASDIKAEPSDGPRMAPGRRDPFRPITLNVRAVSTRRRENLSPLERVEIGQLKLVGVVWNVKDPTALVEDSSGLGYMVKVGTPIGSNDGKIREVRRDSLIVEEFFVDLYGAKKRREVSMRLAVEQ